MPDHLHALTEGHMLGEYRIDRVLGSGGFGITYYAWDTHLDKPVAIKEYLPNEFAVRADATTVQPKSSGDRADYQWGLDRFLDEARTLARFRHHHLNEVYRFFEGNGTAYMVLEYIDGETLSQVLRRDGRLAPERLRRLLDELLLGLDEVHHAGYVHRDVKPGNIMLRADGSAVLLDFGAARQAIGQRSKSVTSILTPGYAPIEQYEQNAEGIGAWTDLYAVGMVAYRCLSGIGESELLDAVTRARLGRKGAAGRDLPPAVEVGAGSYDDALLRAVDCAIRVDESERPQTVSAMREVLSGGATGVAPASAAIAPVSSIPSPSLSSIPTARPPVQIKSAGSGWKRVAPMLLAGLVVVGGAAAGLPFALDWLNWRGIDCKNEVQLKAFMQNSPASRHFANAQSCLAAIAVERKRVAAAKAKSVAAAKAKAAAAAKAKAAVDAKAQRERLARVLGRDFSPRAKDPNGWTDLHYAAFANLHDVARRLIAAGADVNAQLKSDYVPITNSLKRNLRNLLGGTMFDDWVTLGQFPLHMAAWTNSAKTAALLLKNGADIAAKDNYGETPLHYAAWRNADKTAALLLKNGADVAAKSNAGDTPLHSAAWRNADKTAALLLKNGADVAAKSNDGDTPLHVAAWENADKTAALLLKNGADVAAKSNASDTPLHSATWRNADKTAALLLKNGADIAAKNNDGETPLHYAAWRNADKTAALLLKNGANRYARTYAGKTPLDVANDANSDKVIHLLQN